MIYKKSQNNYPLQHNMNLRENSQFQEEKASKTYILANSILNYSKAVDVDFLSDVAFLSKTRPAPN